MALHRAFFDSKTVGGLKHLSCRVNYQISRSLTSEYLKDDFQYLHRGQIPMLHFQRSLPRLPIPKLEKTCERYLAAISPILKDNNEYQRTEKLVTNFRTGPGQQLQKLLTDHDKANKHTSYISEPWFDMYLEDRKPLPINYTPVLILKYDEKNPAMNDQLTRTGNLVLSTLRFMRSLRENILEPEVYHMNPKKSDTARFRKIASLAPESIATFVAYVFKAFPLDMSQYQGLFGGTRIPEIGKDRIVRDQTSTHICVMVKGHIFAVNVLDNEGNIIPPRSLINRLKYVMNSSVAQKPAENPLGILTTENRDRWAEIRAHLHNTHNENSLQIVDSALFCVCLDESVSESGNPVSLVQHMLHGKKTGIINRWYDKSLSLIIGKDGSAGVSFEHSWGDGVAILRLFNEIYKDSIDRPFCNPDDATAPTSESVVTDTKDAVFLVEFNVDDKVKNDIKQASSTFAATLKSLEMNAMIYNGMNKGFCKKHRVSPDAIMQLGFQLAFAKQYNEFVGTYESCSTAAFRHGRTETVRPCTTATKNLCETIIKARKSPQGLSDIALRQLIEKASEVHGNLIKEAAMGQGFDRHLFGLRHIGLKNGIEPDALYSDEAYKKINCNILSSSTLTSPGLLAGGFGPVEANGYGIGYNIQDEFLGTIVTNYTDKRNGRDFAACLRESYDDIKQILELKKD